MITSVAFVQSGDVEQCRRNSTPNFEYKFGKRLNRPESNNGYEFIDAKGRTLNWSMQKKYTTGFKLYLKF
jgi:hypothetical protein